MANEIYNYLNQGNTKLIVKPRLVSNGITKLLDQFEVDLTEATEVVIGDQTWKIKNLDIDDGLGGIYAYNNNESNVATYGRLYTWDAAARVSSIASGWHLPSVNEWNTLVTYLGGASIAGGKLKEAGTVHWSSPNDSATNESGLTLLPSGYFEESFNGINTDAQVWSSTEFDTLNSWLVYLSFSNGNIGTNYYLKGSAYSVRLIKD